MVPLASSAAFHRLPAVDTKTHDLVIRGQDGDRGALDEMFARYQPRLLKVIRERMGARLRGRVQSLDLLQDALATAVRAFPRFKFLNRSSLINWLAKIAEGAIHDELDRVNALKRTPDREQSLDADDSATELEAEPVVPLDRLVQSEEQALVKECVEALRPDYREMIQLRNYAGLSFREIAERTARPSEGAARMMHAKAMRELVSHVQPR